MNSFKIYLKDSDKARCADVRIRIVKDEPAREPCDHEDLVFHKASSEDAIPDDALFIWTFNYPETPMHFFTTAERCKQMVSEDPSYWTTEKLAEFAKIEHRLYQDWYDGRVYGHVKERWNEKTRSWEHVSSCYGYYGTDEILLGVKEAMDNEDIVVCINDEEMKYDFDNAEKKVNEFS